MKQSMCYNILISLYTKALRMPNDGKTITDDYQRFPKNRKTLYVRWLKHGVTAPRFASDFMRGMYFKFLR